MRLNSPLLVVVMAVSLAVPYRGLLAEETFTQTKATQAQITPAGALQMLKEGNARFAAGRSLTRDYLIQVRETARGQYPFASVVGCIDSRSAPEQVFDQGIGDIFSARLAGNVIDDDVLGSLEFASKVAGSRLIVVLGHTDCGAIKGACDNVQLGNLTQLLAKLRPAVDAVPDDGGPRTSKNARFVQQVADMNVSLGVRYIREHSPVLREMQDRGEIAIVGAMYDISSGRVEFFQ